MSERCGGHAVRQQQGRRHRSGQPVYADMGYHGASLREIAKRAGNSHMTLLHHLPDREALLAAVLERRDEEDTARIAAQVSSSRGAVQELVGLAKHNARHPGMVEL
ncbi:TetR/AcrR family transcriptional regulator [Streptomyces sp. NPDC004752]